MSAFRLLFVLTLASSFLLPSAALARKCGRAEMAVLGKSMKAIEQGVSRAPFGEVVETPGEALVHTQLKGLLSCDDPIGYQALIALAVMEGMVGNVHRSLELTKEAESRPAPKEMEIVSPVMLTELRGRLQGTGLLTEKLVLRSSSTDLDGDGGGYTIQVSVRNGRGDAPEEVETLEASTPIGQITGVRGGPTDGEVGEFEVRGSIPSTQDRESFSVTVTEPITGVSAQLEFAVLTNAVKERRRQAAEAQRQKDLEEQRRRDARAAERQREAEADRRRQEARNAAWGARLTSDVPDQPFMQINPSFSAGGVPGADSPQIGFAVNGSLRIVGPLRAFSIIRATWDPDSRTWGYGAAGIGLRTDQFYFYIPTELYAGLTMGGLGWNNFGSRGDIFTMGVMMGVDHRASGSPVAFNWSWHLGSAPTASFESSMYLLFEIGWSMLFHPQALD